MCNTNSKLQGYIFNIQHYSLHDGDGIRTVVFLKGCPLRCKWCSNPESQQFCPQISFNKAKCIGTENCSYCLSACEHGAVAVVENEIKINRNNCKHCLKCSKVCPSKAISAVGKLMSVNDVLDIVEKDSLFYARSRGGLTLSGGEPLAQSEFAVNILQTARKRYINTAIETCGYVKWDVLQRAAACLDTILYDIKCMNDEKHVAYTGVSNSLILDNFDRLCKEFPNIKIIARTPVIPTFNDSIEEIDKILSYVKSKQNVSYEFLPYHPFGVSKYEFLGQEYSLGDVKLSENILKYITQLNSVQCD